MDITLKRIEVNIIVKDINGIMVDCMIQLIDSDGNMLYEWSSDAVIGISDLYAGNSYTVRITGTPAGYFIPEDTELLIPDEAPDKDLLSKTIEVYPFKVMIRSIDSDSGTPISGNKMQLFSDGKLITEWTSQNGYTSVSGIYAGKTYTIHQKNTADHYLPGEDVSFTIPSKPTGNESVFSYQVTNTPFVTATGSVHSISGSAVSGAKYGIYTDANCTSPAKTITGESALFTTDTSGTFTADLRNGTYYIRQIDVPANYYRNNDVYVLTVNRGKSATAVLDLSCKQVRYSFSVVDDSDETYNDATESSEPTLTSIDTLATKLSEYNDANYNNGHPKKMIIAINLGTLSNFIESEKGKQYTKLKEFVTNNNILSGYRHDTGYFNNSVFQFVSFSDYQIFELNSTGVDTTFLQNLIGKVFKRDDSNPFYLAHKNCVNCPLKRRCPVNHNYGFMSDPTHQKNVIARIIEVIIKDKAIVSTRDVLNLVFDLLVHPDFNEKDLGIGVNDIEFISNYINWTTPMILNGFPDVSPLLDQIVMHDTLKNRTSLSDENATSFHSMENIGEVLGNIIDGTPYETIKSITNISILGAKKPGLKKDIYCFLARLTELTKNTTTLVFSERMNEYIKYLYLQNSNNEQKLINLYKATKKAIYGWDWDDQSQDDCICIDDTNDYYWILEKLELEPVINKNDEPSPNSIRRFSTVLSLGFRKAQDESPDNIVNISIDYALYELIMDMQNGYRPTVQDKNRHTEFVSSIRQLIEFKSKKLVTFIK